MEKTIQIQNCGGCLFTYDDDEYLGLIFCSLSDQVSHQELEVTAEFAKGTMHTQCPLFQLNFIFTKETICS